MMKGYNFGNRSLKQLKTCHKDLQLIAEEALKYSDVDFGVSCGHRSLADQLEAYRNDKSQIDGITKKGKHNSTPSMAMGIYVYVPGPKKSKLAYSIPYLAYLGGVITSTAKKLFEENKIKHQLRWGYNWDNDGEIGTDQKFQDMPHFELY